MRISKLSFGLAALALVAAPAVAQSTLAPRVAPLSGSEQAQGEGGSGGLLLGVLAGAAIIGAIIVASDSSDTQLPVSP